MGSKLPPKRAILGQCKEEPQEIRSYGRSDEKGGLQQGPPNNYLTLASSYDGVWRAHGQRDRDFLAALELVLTPGLTR